MRLRIRIYVFVILSCGVKTAVAQTSLIDSIIAPSSLRYLVETLAHDSMQGRFTGSQQVVSAARIIATEFSKAGASPVAGNEGYYMPFDNNGVIINVIAVIPGKSKANELVLFGAHYDHIGTTSSGFTRTTPEHGKPEKRDRIYNGANDNASGVSGLIHLARYFARLHNNERTLIFAAFSGEELGLLGSKQMAKSFDPEVIKAMINMDMIGRPVSAEYDHPVVTGSDKTDLITILNKQLFALAPEYGETWFKPDRFKESDMFQRSDNFSFAARGVPAHTIITSSPDDEYYHSLNDEADKLNYPFMTKVLKAIALGCSGIIAGTDTPSRINIWRLYLDK